ncbi:biotin-dependent carboxyltransferase family protein [Gordonia sp. ABSL1-1]|uniref:5-oxoprolinase subunit C family protein n=1 Tax=Gordonia sp. ABSL1-1 TaxID=3053923 RepID=UPI0025724AEB|nr:biotin-dependent carboxyltransferase family protein [Gordonia sp. ABSL1-1]MDL9938022.1 biotin-dependent carboxyltransferase family protein [Gordonia sp. ABSL1-1]
MTALQVLSTGPLATVQDSGRPGFAHLGVPHSGAADRTSFGLANRLVGNRESAAAIEVTLGGLRLRADADILVAVTGALTTVSVNGSPVGLAVGTTLRAGDELSVGTPRQGCRNYVAIRGGVDVPPTLGSRSTDTLSGLGPMPLRAGDELPVGAEVDDWPAIAAAPADGTIHQVTVLRYSPGPRAGHADDPELLRRGLWQVGADSNRVGIRLARRADSEFGALRHRLDAAELRSEGIAHGSVQLPPGGNPVIFLADHPVTGGYPVIAVLDAAAADLAAQLTPGSTVRFRNR